MVTMTIQAQVVFLRMLQIGIETRHLRWDGLSLKLLTNHRSMEVICLKQTLKKVESLLSQKQDASIFDYMSFKQFQKRDGWD